MPTKEDKSAALQGLIMLPYPWLKHGFLQQNHKDHLVYFGMASFMLFVSLKQVFYYTSCDFQVFCFFFNLKYILCISMEYCTQTSSKQTDVFQADRRKYHYVLMLSLLHVGTAHSGAGH